MADFIFLIGDHRTAEFEDRILRQRQIFSQERDKVVEEFLIGERMRRNIAEEPDIAVLVVPAAQLLDASEQQQIVERGDEAFPFGDRNILAGRNHVAVFTADPGIGFVKFALALRQADHRLQHQIDPVLGDAFTDQMNDCGVIQIRRLWRGVWKPHSVVRRVVDPVERRHFIRRRRPFGDVGKVSDQALQHLDLDLGHDFADVFFETLAAAAIDGHRLDRFIDIADLFAGPAQLAHHPAMAGAKILDLLDQLALFFLVGEYLMQQLGTHQHHGTEHDGGIRIDSGNCPGQDQRDRGGND